jgi:hypothetical protein
MIKVAASVVAAAALMTSAAFAQAPAPSTAPAAPTAPAAAPVAPKAPAATTAPASNKAPVVALDAAGEAKFKGFDKNANGALDGAEVAGFKDNMTKIDTDKDGKISKAEFAAALKGGVIK